MKLKFTFIFVYFIFFLGLAWNVEANDNDKDYTGRSEDVSQLSNATSSTTEKIADKDLVCKESIRHKGMFGSITSPNYPNDYGNNISCLWGIRTPKGHLIAVKLGNFLLEGGLQERSKEGSKMKEEKCAFDFLYIFEQRNVGSNFGLYSDNDNFRHSLGTYCGYIPPTTIHSTIPGSRVYFYFRSDGSKTAKGFTLAYRIFPEAEISASNLPAFDEDFSKLFPESKEEEFLKAFSCILFIIILSTIVIGTIYKCWQSTAEQLATQGRAQHSCCFGAIQLDLITADRVPQNLTRGRVTPRLPTPPPEYGDIVKTDEEWNRVIQQLGEESANEARLRAQEEEVQVTYDLNESNQPLTLQNQTNISTPSGGNQQSATQSQQPS